MQHQPTDLIKLTALAQNTKQLSYPDLFNVSMACSELTRLRKIVDELLLDCEICKGIGQTFDTPCFFCDGLGVIAQ